MSIEIKLNPTGACITDITVAGEGYVAEASKKFSFDKYKDKYIIMYYRKEEYSQTNRSRSFTCETIKVDSGSTEYQLKEEQYALQKMIKGSFFKQKYAYLEYDATKMVYTYDGIELHLDSKENLVIQRKDQSIVTVDTYGIEAHDFYLIYHELIKRKRLKDINPDYVPDYKEHEISREQGKVTQGNSYSECNGQGKKTSTIMDVKEYTEEDITALILFTKDRMPSNFSKGDGSEHDKLMYFVETSNARIRQ